MIILDYLMSRILPDRPSDLDIWMGSYAIFLGMFWAVGLCVYVVRRFLF
jgi:hypothetical protein